MDSPKEEQITKRASIRIPVSIGELADKVSILSIKIERIKDPETLAHVQRERELLQEAIARIELKADSEEMKALRDINLKLWDLENAVRRKEKLGQFDDEFIQLARAIYRYNDKRSMVKRRISLKYCSELVEEKEYEML